MRVGVLLLGASFAAGSATAHSSAGGSPSVFFGFDMLLAPFAVKWACDAPAGPDLDALRAFADQHGNESGAEDVIAFVAEIERRIRSDSLSVEAALGASERNPATLTPASRMTICDAALRLAPPQEYLAAFHQEREMTGGKADALRDFFAAGETLEWETN